MTTLHRTAALSLCLLPLPALAQGPTEPPVYLRFLRALVRPDLPVVRRYAAAVITRVPAAFCAPASQ